MYEDQRHYRKDKNDKSFEELQIHDSQPIEALKMRMKTKDAIEKAEFNFITLHLLTIL